MVSDQPVNQGEIAIIIIVIIMRNHHHHHHAQSSSSSSSAKPHPDQGHSAHGQSQASGAVDCGLRWLSTVVMHAEEPAGAAAGRTSRVMRAVTAARPDEANAAL